MAAAALSCHTDVMRCSEGLLFPRQPRTTQLVRRRHLLDKIGVGYPALTVAARHGWTGPAVRRGWSGHSFGNKSSLKTAMMWTIRNTHLLEMFGWNEALPSYVVAAPRLFGGSGLSELVAPGRFTTRKIMSEIGHKRT